MAKEMRTRISMLSTKLVKQLKRRDKHAYKLQRNFDVLTAILQAVSLKRREYKLTLRPIQITLGFFVRVSIKIENESLVFIGRDLSVVN